MRIAFLTWRDTTHPDGGGSEIYVESVGAELVARGHEVTVRCARYPGSARTTTVAGVRIERRGGRLGVYPAGLAWLLGRGRSYDVVVDVINGVPFATPLIRRRGVIALVHHLHREQWHIIYPRFWGHVGWFLESRLTPRLYRRVQFLTVSNASAGALAMVGVDQRRVTVARNGLVATPSAAVRSAAPRLCVLARLVPHKRIEHALRLVAELRETVSELHLDVVGEGWWHPRLAAACADLGVGDSVTFHGHVTNTERDRLLGEAWLMVLPSVREGWGLAVLEAAAQGTPTAAYRSAGGVAESVVDGVTGVLAEDYADLRARVQALLDDQATLRRLGNAARQRATQFTWAKTADTVEEVLARSVSETRS